MRKRKTNRILTIAQANAIAAGRARVSVSPVDKSLWLVEGEGWTETHEPMTREAWERFLQQQASLGSGAGDHDGSGTGEGVRARCQHEKDERGPGPHCTGCGCKITIQQAETNGTLCDECRGAMPRGGFGDHAEEALREALRENLSPQAVAAIAAHLMAARTRNDGVNKEIRWLADQLVNLIGTDQYNALCEEVGL